MRHPVRERPIIKELPETYFLLPNSTARDNFNVGEQAMSTEETTREGPQSVQGPRINKGLVIVNTGNGKGKTTAAMGVLFRA